jgi:hypothetical protein
VGHEPSALALDTLGFSDEPRSSANGFGRLFYWAGDSNRSTSLGSVALWVAIAMPCVCPGPPRPAPIPKSGRWRENTADRVIDWSVLPVANV